MGVDGASLGADVAAVMGMKTGLVTTFTFGSTLALGFGLLPRGHLVSRLIRGRLLQGYLDACWL